MSGTTCGKRILFLAIVLLPAFIVFSYHYYSRFFESSTTTTTISTNTISTSNFNLHLSQEKQTVIFLETSGVGTLSLRQLASVESAARFVPKSNIRVLVFTDEKYLLNSHMAALENGYNIQFIKVSFKDYMKNTPLEPWYEKGMWKKSPYVIVHMSDALRLLSLWRYGGMYFDLDIILTRMWDVKDNTVIREDELHFSNAVLVFKRKHSVLLNCLTWLENHYKPNEWSANGPALLTDKVNGYLRNDHRHDNITVLPVSTFFEIKYYESEKFFDTKFTTEVLNRTRSSFGVHIWNKMSAGISVPRKSTCAYKVILSKSSPIIHARMQNEN